MTLPLDVRVPDSVREGAAWLGAVPRLVRELVAEWDLAEMGEPFAGGRTAFVAPARRARGEMVVLKVAFQSHETRNEADALRLWNGEGAVMLLEHDRGRGGMLLERLVPGSYLQAHPRRDEAISIVCRLAREEVIVNWDLHLQNVLSAEREPWLLIDPKPLVGDPAFDAGHLQMDPWGERQGRIAELLSASR